LANPAARETGASDKPIVVTHQGQKYTLIPSSEWDLDVLEAIEDQKTTHILRAVLAGDGYERYSATKPKLNEIPDFVEKVFKALGVQGN
jgi:hypothetical protein